MKKVQKEYNIIFAHLALAIFIFIPKINIVEISGYWQGIRFEDIFLAFYAFFLLKNSQNFFIVGKKFDYKPGLVLFLFLLFSNTIALIKGTDIKYFMVARLFEYIFLLYFINNIKCDKNFIYRIICFYVIVNFVVVTFQNNDIIGSFSSRGYLDTSHHLNQRKFGLAGGSWELGILLTLCFFIILKHTKNLVRDFFIFTPLIYYQILLSYSKTSIIAFGIVVIFYIPLFLKHFVLKYNKLQIILLITFFIQILAIIFFKRNLDFNLIPAITDFDYQGFYILLSEFIFDNKIPEITQIDKSLFSMWHRLLSWQDMISIYISSETNLFFGTGFTKYLYLESMYVRIITSFGAIGIFFILFYILSINIYHLIYLIIIGFSFDIFVSFKILLFFLILVKNFDKEEKIVKIYK